MGNDGEITNARKLCHAGGYDGETGVGQGGLKGWMRSAPRSTAGNQTLDPIKVNGQCGIVWQDNFNP
jgi:hypothetical protein